MGLRINTNLSALTAQRNLAVGNQALQRTLERLSTGLRINRAADDAAGLAIAEKMNTQIRGFGQALANVQDGVNLIATAESGLEQGFNILQRIRELAIQSANDTLIFADRQKIQEEINQLTQELDRLAKTTEFNTRKLLDGSLSSSRARERGHFEIVHNARIGSMAVTVPKLVDMARVLAPNQIVGVTELIDLVTSVDADHFVLDTRLIATGPVPPNPIFGTQDIRIERIATDTSPPVNQLGTVSFLRNVLGFNAITIAIYDNGVTIGGVEFNLVNMTLTDVGKNVMIAFARTRQAVTTDNALTFQIGANEGQFLRAGIEDITAKGLRVEGLNLLHTIDAVANAFAQNVMQSADDAIAQISTIRSRLGAFQNRLESALASLSVSKENLASSMSRIRDTDLAHETAELTRYQIIQQAGTSILAQANVNSRTALSLLV